MIRAAIDGVSETFLMEEHTAPHLASGQLVRVLEDWARAVRRLLSLYHPTRRQQLAALSALLDALRLDGKSP